MAEIKLFGKYSYNVRVEDESLRPYINLKPMVIPKTYGRTKDKHIVELLITHCMVPGHKGKKHKWTSGICTGKYYTIYNQIKKAFEIIEKKTKENPLQVFIKAIENAAPYEQAVSQQQGGIIVRIGAVCSPRRRLLLALRKIAQGAFFRTHRNKKSFAECLAQEIIAASQKSNESFAIQERERMEKEAEGMK